MRRPIVFMYSGQGAQYFQMGKELFENNAVFHENLERCARVVDPLIGASLIAEIYREKKSVPFNSTRFTHPANVALAYCLTQVLASEGVRPDVLLGYSLGEYIAAIVAGAVSLEDALANVTRQALVLEEQTVPGGMLAVLGPTSLIKSRPDLFGSTTLACHNFDNHFVVTGYPQDLKRIEQALSDDEVSNQILPITHGFHSAIIEPAQQSLIKLMQGLFSDTTLPTWSAMTAKRVDQFNPEHMWNVIRQPVRFFDVIKQVEAEYGPTYVDVGPAGTLTTFTKYALGAEVGKRAHMTINQFGRDIKSMDTLIKTLRAAGY